MIDVDCRGKVRFETFGQAQRIKEARRNVDKKRQPYHCLNCKGFHLGAKLRKGKQI